MLRQGAQAGLGRLGRGVGDLVAHQANRLDRLQVVAARFPPFALRT